MGPVAFGFVAVLGFAYWVLVGLCLVVVFVHRCFGGDGVVAFGVFFLQWRYGACQAAGDAAKKCLH